VLGYAPALLTLLVGVGAGWLPAWLPARVRVRKLAWAFAWAHLHGWLLAIPQTHT